MRKILSAIIILTMIISTLSMVVFATETAENTGDLMGVTLTTKKDLAKDYSSSGIVSTTGVFTAADLDENNYLVANFKVRNNGTTALTLHMSFHETTSGSWIYEAASKTVQPGQFSDFKVTFKTPFTKDGDKYTFVYTRDGKDYVIDLKNVAIRFQSGTNIPAGTSLDIVCTDENGYEKLALFKGKGGDKYDVADYRAVGKKAVDEPTVGGASIITTKRNHRCSSPSQELVSGVNEYGVGTYYVSGYVRLLQTPDKPVTVGIGATLVADTTSWPQTAKTTISDNQWHKVSGTWNIAKENITSLKTFAEVLYSGQSGDAGAYLGDMEWDAFAVYRLYDDGSYGENLFVNPDMNIDSTGATSGWGKNQGFTMTNSLVPVQDENALHVEDRSSNTSGPSQNILGRLEKGKYLYSGYVRLIEAPEEAKSVSIGIEYKNTEGTASWPSVSTKISDTEWHKISGTVEIKYDVANHAVTFVNTFEKSGQGADIELDAVFLAKQNDDGTYSENIILNPTMEYDETGATPEWGVYRVATITNTGFKTEEPETPEIPTDPVENPDGSITYPDGTVPVSDKNILYSGRFYDASATTKQAAFESYVEIKFTGTSLQVLTPASATVYAEIDGNLRHTLYALSSSPVIVKDLPEGTHTVKLIAKAQTCNFTFSGFKLDKGAKTLPIEEPKKIEFIGDSISEGYVNSADKLPDLDGNSYLNSFTSKTGFKLNKEYGWSFNTVAFGGIGMVRTGSPDPLTMPERYFTSREYLSSIDGTTRETALAKSGTYDKKYVPDYIVINMGTNDSAYDNKTFLNTYVDFIASLKEVNPNVTIFCMAPFNGTKALQVRMAAETYGEDEKVFFIDSSKWGVPGGADNLHPAPASLDKAAENLFAVIKDYVDNGVVPENAPFENGMQFNVTSDIYHAYPYFRAGATNATGLTVADADENGYITRSYTIYNVGNCDLPIRTYWQTGWNDLKDTTASATLTVEKGKKATITLQIQIDEDGMATKKDGTKVALSTLTFRTQIDIGTTSNTVIPAGASYIVTPDDPMDFAVLNISSKAIQKGTDGTGAVDYNTIEMLPEEKIMGATVDIGTSLTVNYYAQLWDNLDATLKVTRNGATVELEGVYDSATGCYRYQYKGVNPQCMTDNISAELVVDGKVISSKTEYSVKEYANNLANKTAAQLNLTDEKYNELITLLSDMLVYGKNSQDYMKYNLDNYATDGITWLNASEFTTPENVVKNIIMNDANNKIAGAGVRVENVNRIYFTVRLTGDAEVYVDGEKAEVIDNKVYTKDIKASGFGTIHTAEIKVNGETVSKVEYNVNAYINAKNADAKIGILVKSLNNYGVSAVAYGK